MGLADLNITERVDKFMWRVLPIETAKEGLLMLLCFFLLFFTGVVVYLAWDYEVRYNEVATAYNDLRICSKAIELYNPQGTGITHPQLATMGVEERQRLVRTYCRGHLTLDALEIDSPLYFEVGNLEGGMVKEVDNE